MKRRREDNDAGGAGVGGLPIGVGERPAWHAARRQDGA